MHLVAVSKETPRALTAILGLGLAVFVRESSAMTSVYTMAGPDIAQYGFFSATLVAVVMAGLYRVKPKLRISRYHAFNICLAVMTSLSMMVALGELPDVSNEMNVVAFSAYQIGSFLIVVAWCEVLIRLGSQRVGLVFAGSVFVYALCNMLVIVLRQDIAGILSLLLPLVSIGLLVFYQKGSQKDPSDPEKPRMGEHQAISQNFLMPISQTRIPDRRRNMALGAMILLTIFCFRFAFGYVNGAWIPLQDSSTISFYGQVSNMVGTLVAGLLMILLLEKCWNQSTLLAMEMATLVSLMLCLYLLAGYPDLFACFGVLPIAFGQKLILLIVLLSPFLVDAKNPPFVLCISLALNMGALGVFSHASLAASAQGISLTAMLLLGVLIFVAFALFFLLNGNYSESTYDAARRLEQSSFNENERLPAEELPQHTVARCLDVAELYGLTQRETEVLLLLANRYNASSIADLLIISEATTKTHMRKIYAKLDVHSQKDLIKLINEEA